MYPAPSRQEVLSRLPQKPPFLFLDELLHLDEEGAVGRYTFRPEESFYAGHFPRDPVTPGVILLETMAQTGVVALGIYLLLRQEGPNWQTQSPPLFVEAEVEFNAIVRPGETVTTRAEKVLWRRGKLRSRVAMSRNDGSVVATGQLAGMLVRS